MGRARTTGEVEFRLRPARPPLPQGDRKVWSGSYKALIRLVRMTQKSSHVGRGPLRKSDGMTRRPHWQRCAVRITYCSNRVRGQWAAHGRYLARESATGGADGKLPGFSADSTGIDPAKVLGEWQRAGDPRVFKFILSPEFGERLNLERLTRELLSRMQKDLGTRLDWVAVAHFNTGHPHIHLVLRGQSGAGPLQLGRDYIKHAVRQHAEYLCTAQLGFRTELDALQAERREVDAVRVTSLDRRIARRAFGGSGDGTIDLTFDPPSDSDLRQAREQLLAARLRTLRTMELAEEVERDRWCVDPSFLSVLQAMQTSQDRQRMLALIGSLARHDARPPVQRVSVTRVQADKGSPGRGAR